MVLSNEAAQFRATIVLKGTPRPAHFHENAPAKALALALKPTLYALVRRVGRKGCTIRDLTRAELDGIVRVWKARRSRYGRDADAVAGQELLDHEAALFSALDVHQPLMPPPTTGGKGLKYFNLIQEAVALRILYGIEKRRGSRAKKSAPQNVATVTAIATSAMATTVPRLPPAPPSPPHDSGALPWSPGVDCSAKGGSPPSTGWSSLGASATTTKRLRPAGGLEQNQQKRARGVLRAAVGSAGHGGEGQYDMYWYGGFGEHSYSGGFGAGGEYGGFGDDFDSSAFDCDSDSS
eukprot:SAG25_NODE_1008_length_4323_cov_5.595206_6_plen_293_part_00